MRHCPTYGPKDSEVTLMLANLDPSAKVGALNGDVQKPATFRHELLGFIANEMPRWRDCPDRPPEISETILTSQLCAHLNTAARCSVGWDILQFAVEKADERNKGRKIDLAASPSGTVICIEGRRHTDFDTLMPIECKRLPTPKANDRDEREYVFSRFRSTGGIQRFKAGHHGAAHKSAAMIGYLQEETTTVWEGRVATWIRDLIDSAQPGWSPKDQLSVEKRDPAQRLTVFRSYHERQHGLEEIEVRHLWIEMN
jgi:hypothetical protein